MNSLRRLRIKVLASIVIALAALVQPPVARADPPVCDAGGPGAYSCSLGWGESSCSVTCFGSSTFACCGRDSGCYCYDMQ